MNDSPLSDVDCRKNTRINSRIPKVSALDKRLRHIIRNSNTHAIVDLTQQVNNPMNTAIRSTFTTKNPWAGDKDEINAQLFGMDPEVFEQELGYQGLQ